MGRTAPSQHDERERTPRGGYARGEETRARIVAAALHVFGAHGFAGASTRMLAHAAQVTLPALQYYFDSKEGLYLACAEHIAARLEALLGPATERIGSALNKRRPSRRELIGLLHEFADGFADLFLGSHELEQWVLFIIREQAQPTRAFDIIFDRVVHRVVTMIAALVGRLTRLPADHPQVNVQALALVGQIIFFRTSREAALRVLGWQNFDGEHLALVKRTLRAQIVSMIDAAPRRKK